MGFGIPKSGMESLLSSMGIDLPDMMEKFKLLQQYVVAVDQRLGAIQKQNEEILKLLRENIEAAPEKTDATDGDGSGNAGTSGTVT